MVLMMLVLLLRAGMIGELLMMKLLHLLLLLLLHLLLLLLLHLLLLLLRIVRLVLSVPLIIAVVEAVIRRLRIAALLLPLLRLLLSLLLVVRVLLPKLLLRRRDHPEVVLGMLIIIFRRDRIAGALRVARELDVFFRNLGSGAANLHVGPVRLIDPRQWILALAVMVIIAPSPHPLVTVSHGAVR
jgi:hypothetical protein